METPIAEKVKTWYKATRVEDVPEDGGACVKYEDRQIAVFYFARRDEWYATQNMCPHKKQMILSRGMIGTAGDIPKVACPYHKKTFSLCDGSNLNGEDYRIDTYPVKVKDGYVYIGIPG